VVTEKNTAMARPRRDRRDRGGICAVWNARWLQRHLAAGASVDFTCTFNAPANGDDVDWSALGQGKDSLDAAAPDTGEHQSGHIAVIKPATSLSVKTAAPAKVHAETRSRSS
jgi:hypothetical protein